MIYLCYRTIGIILTVLIQYIFFLFIVDPKETLPPPPTTISTPEPPCKEECKDLKLNLVQCGNCKVQHFEGTTSRGSRRSLTIIKNTKAPTTFAFTNQDGIVSMPCKRCRMSKPLYMCKKACLYMFRNSITPFQQGYSTNMMSTEDSTKVDNIKISRVTTRLDAVTQTDLLSRLLEYKESEFWFISIATGLIVVLLVIIILVLVSQRRKKHKIVDPRIY